MARIHRDSRISLSITARLPRTLLAAAALAYAEHADLDADAYSTMPRGSVLRMALEYLSTHFPQYSQLSLDDANSILEQCNWLTANDRDRQAGKGESGEWGDYEVPGSDDPVEEIPAESRKAVLDALMGRGPKNRP